MSKIDLHFMRRALKPTAQEDGGEGSGNFGHAGRVGKVGGSAPAKGAAAGEAKAQKSHIEAQRRAVGTSESPAEYEARIKRDVLTPPKPPKQQNVPVTGKDLGRRYFYDANKSPFKYEIEDVIHTQGFDGVPKLVSRAEFDNYVKSNPNALVMMRSYSAPNEDVLKGYDESLESGTWYVNCSHARADYGQGMYVNAFYAKDSDDKMPGALKSMRRVRDIREGQCARGLGAYFGDSNYGEATVFQQNQNKEHPQRYELAGEPQDIDFDKIKEGEYYAITLESKSTFGDDYTESLLMTRKNGKLEWVTRHEEFPIVKSIDPEAWFKGDEKTVRKFMQKMKVLPDARPVSSTRLMALMPDAKIVNSEDLYKDKRMRPYEDIGVFAARLGYDAIWVPSHDYAVVLNRTKVILCDERLDVNGGAA